MKKKQLILLSLIFIITVMGCKTETNETATPPEETEAVIIDTPEADELEQELEPDYDPEQIWRDFSYLVPQLNREMIGFISNYPVTLEEEDEEEYLVQEFMIGRGGNWVAVVYLPGGNISMAKVNSDNIYSLVEDKRLPLEAESREVTVEEIYDEAADALACLKDQISASYMVQEHHEEWIRGLKNEEINRDSTIADLNEKMDDYRGGVNKLSQRLEVILEKCDVYFDEINVAY